MNIAISLVAIVSPVLIYWYVIRPRLKARFVDTYAHLDGFWARVWARIVAFRTWIIGAVGLVLPEVIDIAMLLVGSFQGLSGADITFLPGWAQTLIRGATLVALMVNQARKTTPDGMPEPGAETK